MSDHRDNTRVRDRRKDRTPELSEVRTVLSRAITARCTLTNLERLDAKGGGMYGSGWKLDPEHAAMAVALDQAIALLQPWAGDRKSFGQKVVCHE